MKSDEEPIEIPGHLATHQYVADMLCPRQDLEVKGFTVVESSDDQTFSQIFPNGFSKEAWEALFTELDWVGSSILRLSYNASRQQVHIIWEDASQAMALSQLFSFKNGEWKYDGKPSFKKALAEKVGASAELSEQGFTIVDSDFADFKQSVFPGDSWRALFAHLEKKGASEENILRVAFKEGVISLLIFNDGNKNHIAGHLFAYRGDGGWDDVSSLNDRFKEFHKVSYRFQEMSFDLSRPGANSEAKILAVQGIIPITSEAGTGAVDGLKAGVGAAAAAAAVVENPEGPVMVLAEPGTLQYDSHAPEQPIGEGGAGAKDGAVNSGDNPAPLQAVREVTTIGNDPMGKLRGLDFDDPGSDFAFRTPADIAGLEGPGFYVGANLFSADDDVARYLQEKRRDIVVRAPEYGAGAEAEACRKAISLYEVCDNAKGLMTVEMPEAIEIGGSVMPVKLETIIQLIEDKRSGSQHILRGFLSDEVLQKPIPGGIYTWSLAGLKHSAGLRVQEAQQLAEQRHHLDPEALTFDTSALLASLLLSFSEERVCHGFTGMMIRSGCEGGMDRLMGRDQFYLLLQDRGVKQLGYKKQENDRFLPGMFTPGKKTE